LKIPDKTIPYGHQWLDDKDIAAVVEVLKSDWLTQGPKVQEFETALAKFVGAKYAVVVNSGTAALHAAYFAAGIKAGDEVITSPITFASTANAALFLGARPVFIDIEPDTGNIDPNLIENAIRPWTKAIIPIHFGGHPVRLAKIQKIAKEHDLLVIEDACHALGAWYGKKKIGNCQYSDLAAFSFHPVKSITTGEGGAVITNSEEFYRKLLMFRKHGMLTNSLVSDKWWYEMHFLGYNYRLTDFQCALGLSQLRKLPAFIRKRAQIARIFEKRFRGNDYFDLPKEKDYAKSAWHLYPIRLKNQYRKQRNQIFAQLRRNKLGVQIHYIPVYWHPYYQKLGYRRGICPAAEDFFQREISLPLYPAMSGKEIKYVTDTVLKIFKKVSMNVKNR